MLACCYWSARAPDWRLATIVGVVAGSAYLSTVAVIPGLLVAAVVTLVITILLYQGAMFRADTSHLTGTLLVVPALVVAVATTLPGCFACAAARRPQRARPWPSRRCRFWRIRRMHRAACSPPP